MREQIGSLPDGRVKAVVAPGVDVLKSVFHRFTGSDRGAVSVRLLALLVMATAAADPAAERVLFAAGCMEIAIAHIKVRLGGLQLVTRERGYCGSHAELCWPLPRRHTPRGRQRV